MERGLLCYFESEEVIFKRYVKQSVPRSDALLSISSGLVGNGMQWVVWLVAGLPRPSPFDEGAPCSTLPRYSGEPSISIPLGLQLPHSGSPSPTLTLPCVFIIPPRGSKGHGPSALFKTSPEGMCQEVLGAGGKNRKALITSLFS